MTMIKRKLIKYEIVKMASEGDISAINMVFQYYSGYIRKLSVRQYTDEFGLLKSFVDYELKSRMESKLLEKLLEFKTI